MLSGRFAQTMEFLSILCVVAGILALCQPWSFEWYQHGLKILIAGWLGLTIWSHRRPLRPAIAEGNPQTTVNGNPPLEATLGSHRRAGN